jgi:hypothetical protein
MSATLTADAISNMTDEELINSAAVSFDIRVMRELR